MDNAIDSRTTQDVRGDTWPWIALLVVAVGVAGFSRSYYLKSLFHSPALPAAVHIHGLLMSLWLATFATQVGLVASNRVRWHQRLGIAAAAIALLVVASGVFLTIRGLQAEIQAHKVGRFHFLLGLNLVNLLLFGVFIGFGLLFRTRPDIHKRCMALAAISLLAPAAARISLFFSHGAMWQFAAFYSCVALCLLLDTVRERRLHPVLGGGSALIVGAFQGVYLIESGPRWLPLISRVFGG